MSDTALEISAAPEISPYVVERITKILAEERIATVLPPSVALRAHIECAVPAGITLVDAHANWLPAYFAQLAAPPELSSQPLAALTPPGLFRVVVHCVQEGSGGMSSYYGFKGHFTSLLVSVPQGHVWDARIESAS